MSEETAKPSEETTKLSKKTTEPSKKATKPSKKKKDDGIIGAMIGLIIALMMLGLMGAMIPKPLGPQYQCPVCGEWFWTEQELHDHFMSEHPAIEIDIEWE